MRLASLLLAVAACSPAQRLERDDGARRLTQPPNGASDQNACWSPDGSFVVFTRFERGYNRGPAHLFRVDVATGETTQLTDGDFDDVNVPWGCFDRATGNVIFASDRGDANDFWEIVPTAGAAPRRLTTHGEQPIWIEPVRSAAAGSAIAFEQALDAADELAQRSSVWLLRAPSTTPVQLTNFAGTDDDRLPSWSPDGTQLVFQHRAPPSDRWDALVLPTSGAAVNVTALTPFAAADDRARHDTDLSWTANGRYILTSSDLDGELPRIWALPVAGGAPIAITTFGEREDGAPCSSPDGAEVAFESHTTADEDSPSQLWIIPMPDAVR